MLQDFESAPPLGMKLLTERLKKREEERDKEDPDERGREHAREGPDFSSNSYLQSLKVSEAQGFRAFLNKHLL